MRIAVAWKSFFLRGEARLARHHERRVLAAVGAQLPAALVGLDDDARGAVARLVALDQALQSHARASEESWAQDRQDYAVAPGWAQWLVIARGIFARAVQRALARGRVRERKALLLQVAALAVAGRLQAPGSTAPLVPSSLAIELAALRTDARAAEQTRVALLVPYGGQALPSWMHTVARELSGLVAATARELQGKLVPRLPALGGLAAGWWVTHTFTDSHVDAALSHLGLRHGGTHVVSSERLERMSFWLPLLVGATCSYLSSRFSGFVHRRYASPLAPPVLAPADPQAASTVLLAAVAGNEPPPQG